MPSMRHHFRALLKNINPSQDRLDLASSLPGDVRTWLKEHDFKTSAPHTRLIGSYGRSTAILDIKDVDILLFLPESELDRTPNAVLLEIGKLLADYPDATINTVGQRRSIRLEFPEHGLHLDIVPAVLSGSLEEPLKVPDRPQAEWVDSDPLGYGKRLSNLNGEKGGKVVHLAKLAKAWRDVQMKVRRPKSYVLEIMVLYASEGGDITFDGESTESTLGQFFAHIVEKYRDLMDNGKEAPRIRDPQIPNHFITKGWERAHFETFMRRIREADKEAQKALAAETVATAEEHWKAIFGELWPTPEEVKAAALEETSRYQPGRAVVGASGLVVGSKTGVVSQPTKFHGSF